MGNAVVIVGDEIHVTVEPQPNISVLSIAQQGPAGPVGPTGPQGAQGIQGVQGEIGPQGPQGAQGVKGDTGDTGATGAQGSQGIPGEQGPQGIQGVQGPAGADGSDGADGHSPVLTWSGDQVAIDGVVSGPHLTGPQGSKGDTGDTGPQGIQGETGAQGIQGVQGIQGEAGSQGPAGPGVAAGGTTGQVLAKNSNADFDTEWVEPTSGDFLASSMLDTDGTLAADSDAKIPSQKAVKAYVDNAVAGLSAGIVTAFFLGGGVEDIDPASVYAESVLNGFISFLSNPTIS